MGDTKKEQRNNQMFLDALGQSYEKEDKKRNKLMLWLLILASLLIIGIILLAITIMRMMPLKQTEPIIAVVDSSSGIVTKVLHLDKDADPSKVDLWIKSSIYSLITARYGYAYVGNGKSLEERYHRVSIFLSDDENRKFSAEVSAENPNSPFSRLGKTGEIEVKVNSINITQDNRFQVQFRTRMRNQGVEQIYSYSAIGAYKVGDYEGLEVEDQWLNSFGLKITSWNVSQDASNDALPQTNSIGLPEQGNIQEINGNSKVTATEIGVAQ